MSKQTMRKFPSHGRVHKMLWKLLIDYNGVGRNTDLRNSSFTAGELQCALVYGLVEHELYSRVYKITPTGLECLRRLEEVEPFDDGRENLHSSGWVETTLEEAHTLSDGVVQIRRVYPTEDNPYVRERVRLSFKLVSCPVQPNEKWIKHFEKKVW